MSGGCAVPPPLAPGSASLVRREPYRLLMPLGVLLAWAGIGHWLLYALGFTESYRSVFHALVQIEGFIVCFALGFLYTMIPRRTQTFPAARWELALATACPVAIAVAAACERWALSQGIFAVLLASAVVFLLRRLRSSAARRRPPNAFVWFPAAFAIALAGVTLAALGATLDPALWWLHQVGQRMVLQGMVLALILGAGSLALPLMTRGEAPPDAGAGIRDRLARLAHVAGACLLAASFFVESLYSFRAGLALRGLVMLAGLLLVARLGRPPTLPGWNRKLIWLAPWAVPAGYALCVLDPAHYKVGLHVTFIGGFAVLALAVGAHVILSHTGCLQVRDGRPWQVPVMAVLLFGAIVPRGLVDLAPGRFHLWLGAAAAMFLAGTGLWLAFLAPKILASFAEARTAPARMDKALAGPGEER